MIQLENIIEKLNQLFSIGDYENAENLINSARKVPNLYNDIVAIFDANLCLSKGNYEEMWFAIKRGLENNPTNYELYVMLGEYYLHSNPNQAYLCFENALFYCDNETDRMQIQTFIDEIKKQHKITVNNVSFIILSYNTLDYTKICIDSIRKNTLASSREIVIVDNASVDGSLEWLREQNDIVLRENIENTGFPKGCNQGVEIANKENDIFLLNSDTYLPANALFWLRMGLYESDQVGSTGSITNYATNSQSIEFVTPTNESYLTYAHEHNIPMQYPYEEKLSLVGFALLIKRSVYNQVGDLDERFSPGNYEDKDYGLRVLKAGYKNVLCWNSFIIHYGSKSFGKNMEKYANLLNINEQKFEEKWKVDPFYYFAPRPELIDQIKKPKDATLNVLEIGCACGVTSAYLKGRYPNATTYGVEVVPEAVNIAQHVTNVICADIETLDFPWEEEFFDYVIIGNVLEYLHEPAYVLKQLRKHIKKDGQIIISMPNMKHYSVIIPLLINDEFDYEDNSLLNKKHTKLYTCKEIMRLIEENGYQIEETSSIAVDSEDPEVHKILDTLVQLSTLKIKEPYLIYEYIVRASKK